ncbi:MAG: hypothetical protein U0797_15770 [Gemmataceae bacterium]
MFHEGRHTHRGPLRAQVPGAVYFVTYRLAGSIPPGVGEHLCAARRRWLRRFALRGVNPSHHLPAALAPVRPVRQPARSPWTAGLARPEAASVVRAASVASTASALPAAGLLRHAQPRPRRDPPAPAAPTRKGRPRLGEQADSAGPLAGLLPTWKQATAKLAGWPQHAESFLHRVRDGEEAHRLVEYVAYNPVKAGLARQVHEWPWCSAHDRFRATAGPPGARRSVRREQPHHPSSNVSSVSGTPTLRVLPERHLDALPPGRLGRSVVQAQHGEVAGQRARQGQRQPGRLAAHLGHRPHLRLEQQHRRHVAHQVGQRFAETTLSRSTGRSSSQVQVSTRQSSTTWTRKAWTTTNSPANSARSVQSIWR